MNYTDGIIGKRITLTEALKDDKYAKQQVGDQGIVTGLGKTPDEQQIQIKWNSGSSLSLLVGIDNFTIA